MSGWYEKEKERLKDEIQRLQTIWYYIYDEVYEIDRLEKIYKDMVTSLKDDHNTSYIIDFTKHQQEEQSSLMSYIWALKCNRNNILNKLVKSQEDLNNLSLEEHETFFKQKIEKTNEELTQLLEEEAETRKSIYENLYTEGADDI